MAAMSLVKCEECGHDVSSRAEACPNCGAPQALAKKRVAMPAIRGGKGSGLGKLLLAALVALFFFEIYSEGPANKLTSSSGSATSVNKAIQQSPQNARKPTQREYLVYLNQEYDNVAKFDVSKWLNSKDRIMTVTALFSRWASVVDDSKDHKLSLEELQRVNSFRKNLRELQIRSFPRLRDAYGPALRKVYWNDDVSARTFGAGYRIVEWVSGSFEANHNTSSWHADVQESLYTLRFTQARYKRNSEVDDYAYYTLKPPKDEDIVIWKSDTSFRVVN
jgi:hypothetical protein